MISRDMQDMYDKISIHTTSSVSQNLEAFTSFYNPYQLLQLEKNPYKNLVTSIMHLDLQIVPFKNLLELPESSSKR